MSPKKTYHQQVAETILEQLKDGTAPWLKPWRPGEYRRPHNPVSGTRYKGGNAVWLSAVSTMKGYDDPRWMTYRQAQHIDAQVRKGEKGTVIQFWKFSEQVPKLDENGNPVLNKKDEPVKVTIELERPKVFTAVVFNAHQIDGLPALNVTPPQWNPHDHAEQILKNSGAEILHDQADKAFYQLMADRIHLPGRDQFDSADRYYATALHELGHWTGHASRLDRDLANPFGSVEYAKEELRAEIASMMLGDELQIGHDPGQHVAYVESWIQVLETDPMEIFRAARDAEQIMEYTMQFEKDLQREDEAFVLSGEPVEHANNRTQTVDKMPANEKTYLAVPYAEKDEAKVLGARWDRFKKTWYAPEGTNLAPLRKWLPENVTHRQAPPSVDPQTEFAGALKNAGLVLDGLPIMDGKLYRVPVENGKPGNRDGAYKGYLDGHPAGFIQNHRTGEKMNWKSQNPPVSLSAEDRAKLKALAAHKKQERQAELTHQYEKKSLECTERWKKLQSPHPEHAYLTSKGVKAHGIKQNKQGDLVVPVRDLDGKIWSLQRINPIGEKAFEKGAKKSGGFHIVGEPRFKASDEILIAEGYATAASIHEATGRPVVMAFDSGNLKAVAADIRKAYPEKDIVITGDNDRHKLAEGKKNTGRIMAMEAACAVEGETIFPTFTPAERGKTFTDFNDLHRTRGLSIVKTQIETALERQKQKKQGVNLKRERGKARVKVKQFDLSL